MTNKQALNCISKGSDKRHILQYTISQVSQHRAAAAAEHMLAYNRS